MTLDEIRPHIPTMLKLAQELGLAKQTLTRWRKMDFIPVKQQYIIREKFPELNFVVDASKNQQDKRIGAIHGKGD